MYGKYHFHGLVMTLFAGAIWEKMAFCVLDFHVHWSVISAQRRFWTKFTADRPSGHTIRNWYSEFKKWERCKRKSTGRSSASEETVERVRESFTRSPHKSTVRGSTELGILQKTVWKILRKLGEFLFPLVPTLCIWISLNVSSMSFKSGTSFRLHPVLGPKRESMIDEGSSA
jgi:hypothetical protein